MFNRKVVAAKKQISPELAAEREAVALNEKLRAAGLDILMMVEA